MALPAQPQAVAVDEVGRGQICHRMGVERHQQPLARNEIFVDQVSQQDCDPVQKAFEQKLENLLVQCY